MKKSQVKKLQRQIGVLLQQELRDCAKVSFQDGMIKIIIPSRDFENGLGALLQRIQQLIDKHYPDRIADMALLISDPGRRYENTFKIWPPAGR